MVFRIRDGVSASESHLYLREEPIRQSFEAFLGAWRVLNGACEDHLSHYGLGPAHHRILFLVGTYKKIVPSVLLKKLGITKQSLGRALGDLKEKGLVEQRVDSRDRRRRPVSLTQQGQELEADLFRYIRQRMTESYRHVDGYAVEGFRRVLGALQASGRE